MGSPFGRRDGTTVPGGSGPGPWVTVLAAYFLLAMVVTWPLPLRISSVLPHDLADPLLNTWILWWNAHALPLSTRWWSAPIFWPSPDAFALSEHLLGLSIVSTPLQWLGAGPVTAYNVIFIGSYIGSALGAHALVHHLSRRHDAAMVAGVVFGFSPFRVAHTAHLQVLSSYLMPVALLALHRYREDDRLSWLALFGIAWLVQALTNGYYLLFFPVLVALWLAWFCRVGDPGRPVAGVICACVIFSVPLIPFLLHYREAHAALELHRTLSEIESFSADGTSWLDAAPLVRFWHLRLRLAPAETELFPGSAAIALLAAVGLLSARRVPTSRGSRLVSRAALTAAVAAAGAVLTVWMFGPWKIAAAGLTLLSVGNVSKPISVCLAFAAIAAASGPRLRGAFRRRSALAFYAIAAGLMYLFAMGPQPRFLGAPFLHWAPYALLLRLPGFDALRVPARFAMLEILCLAVAAGLAFAKLTKARGVVTRRICAVLVIAMAVLDGWSRATPLYALPARLMALEHEPVSVPVIELPLGDVEGDAAAMYRAMFHHHPVVNGYSGYAPSYYLALRLALDHGDDETLTELAGGAPLILVLKPGDARDRFTQWALRSRAVSLEDDAQWGVFRLPRIIRRQTAGEGVPIPVREITANRGASTLGRLTDGLLSTEWNSARAQAGDEELSIDLGGPHHVSTVRLDLGPFKSDFARSLSVDCAGETGVWTECWRGSGAALAFRGMLDDPARAPMSIPIDKDHVRWLRLKQTAADHANGWSIAELVVSGS